MIAYEYRRHDQNGAQPNQLTARTLDRRSDVAALISNPYIAVDVGNTRVKFGLFEAIGQSSPDEGALPQPARCLDLVPERADFDRLVEWLDPYEVHDIPWWIATVNRPWSTQLVDWLSAREPAAELTLLVSGDLPLVVELDRPDMVGIDRLLAAVAANRLRQPGQPLTIVDLGTCIKVDLLAANGAFQGGAILPGIAMSARAFHQFTDLLPLVPMSQLTHPPEAVGKSTVSAMESGLFWGAVGAVRELLVQFEAELGQAPQMILTGGAAPSVAELFPSQIAFAPHLTLAGIALAVSQMPS